MTPQERVLVERAIGQLKINPADRWSALGLECALHDLRSLLAEPVPGQPEPESGTPPAPTDDRACWNIYRNADHSIDAVGQRNVAGIREAVRLSEAEGKFERSTKLGLKALATLADGERQKIERERAIAVLRSLQPDAAAYEDGDTGCGDDTGEAFMRGFNHAVAKATAIIRDGAESWREDETAEMPAGSGR